MNHKLFSEIEEGTIFWFHDRPERRLVKLTRNTYTDGEWVFKADRHVLVFQNGYKKQPSIYDRLQEV